MRARLACTRVREISLPTLGWVRYFIYPISSARATRIHVHVQQLNAMQVGSPKKTVQNCKSLLLADLID